MNLQHSIIWTSVCASFHVAAAAMFARAIMAEHRKTPKSVAEEEHARVAQGLGHVARRPLLPQTHGIQPLPHREVAVFRVRAGKCMQNHTLSAAQRRRRRRRRRQ